MARQRGGGGPTSADPDVGAILRNAADAMGKAEAALARIGETLANAPGSSEEAIRKALEAQRRAIREAARAQEQALAAAEKAISRAMAAAAPAAPRKR
jgi:ABC-type transporter Mla subunit MlaD